MRRPVSRRSAHRSSTAKPPAAALELAITRLGAGGDGVAVLPDGRPAYVPGALAGEIVRAQPGTRRGQGVAAKLIAVLSPAPHRTAPPCQHVPACGGCIAQHMDDALYSGWKAAMAADALRRAGFDETLLAPLARTPPQARRRADLALRRDGKRVVIGFHGRGGAAFPTSGGSSVIDVPGCLVLHPALMALIAALRERLARLACLTREGSAMMSVTEGGVDLWLVTDAAPDAAARVALAAFAREMRLARLSWSLPGDDPEPIASLSPARVSFGGAAVHLPPGAFLQASAEGEAAIVAAVHAGLAGLPDGAPVADLYAGCGTLTFPLASRFRVSAYEGDAGALAALRQAANNAGLAGRVTAQARDLAIRPLQPAEQKGLTAIVLDPPRDGAAMQIATIAAGPVKRVVYVSCNPNALARDAQVLAKAGFRLDAAVPVDQFLWSAHLECVASFSR